MQLTWHYFHPRNILSKVYIYFSAISIEKVTTSAQPQPCARNKDKREEHFANSGTLQGNLYCIKNNILFKTMKG